MGTSGPFRSPPGVDGGALVRRYRSGDLNAFGDLYAAHADSLYRYLRRIDMDEHEAEDLVQDTFLAAVNQLHTLKSESSVTPWLFSIARNQARTRWRARKGYEAPFGSATDVAGHLPESAVEQPFDQVLDLLTIGDLLDRLPSEMRETATLRADGYTNREIASHMGISVRTVIDDLSRLRTVVRRTMEPEPNPVPMVKIETTPPSAIAQAIRSLPGRRREVLLRQAERGLRPKQIAAELNISPNCARVHLNLAYTELAQRLGMPRSALIKQLKPAKPPAPPHRRSVA